MQSARITKNNCSRSSSARSDFFFRDFGFNGSRRRIDAHGNALGKERAPFAAQMGTGDIHKWSRSNILHVRKVKKHFYKSLVFGISMPFLGKKRGHFLGRRNGDAEMEKV